MNPVTCPVQAEEDYASGAGGAPLALSEEAQEAQEQLEVVQQENDVLTQQVAVLEKARARQPHA